MKENQRVALTRRLLHEGLLRLLGKAPIQKITVIALCEESGINRSTFYKHYGSPEDVLREIEVGMITEIFDEVCREKRSYTEDVGIVCAYIDRNAARVRLLMQNNVFIDMPELVELLLRLTNGRYDRCISGCDPEDLELRTTFICYGTYHMFRRWLMDEPRKSPQEIARMICQLTAQGLADAQRHVPAK